MTLKVNARMYAVAPGAAAAWARLLGEVAAEANIALEPLDHPYPKPLEDMWARPDLGMVFMCGLPWAMAATPGGLGIPAQPVPLAAPIPARFGAPVYASDFVVRADSPYRTLEDTFGTRIGWTVHHSQSGLNAPRHHLLRYRTPERPRLYRESVGPLISAMTIISHVLEGRIEVGPLDAYVHELLKLHAPERAAQLRTVATTATAPIPFLVASADTPPEAVDRLRAALLRVGPRPELALLGFAAPDLPAYAATLDWEREALAASYEVPG